MDSGEIMQRSFLLLLLFSLTPCSHSIGGIILTEVDLANNIIELVNDGGADVDLSNWWLCNRVNGSPVYDTFASGASINGLSVEAGGGPADLLLEYQQFWEYGGAGGLHSLGCQRNSRYRRREQGHLDRQRIHRCQRYQSG